MVMTDQKRAGAQIAALIRERDGYARSQKLERCEGGGRGLEALGLKACRAGAARVEEGPWLTL